MNYKLLNQMINYIEDHLTEDIEYIKLAQIVGVSEYSLQRIFSFIANMSLSEYIRKRRLSKAFEELKTTNIKVIDVAIKYNYDSSIYFSRTFKKLFGISPKDCRNTNIEYKLFNNDEQYVVFKEENNIFNYYVGSKLKIDGLDVVTIPKGKYVIFEVGSRNQKDLLEKIKSDIKINLFIDKEPYVKVLLNDKIINLTGQSGSGKSTYAQENFGSEDYLIIDADEIFPEIRFSKSADINKELVMYFRNKYKKSPNCSDNFDLIYSEISEYCKDMNKIIVIDCAQFHCIKYISILKGKIIVIRTCIDKCFERVIKRYKNKKSYI